MAISKSKRYTEKELKKEKEKVLRMDVFSAVEYYDKIGNSRHHQLKAYIEKHFEKDFKKKPKPSKRMIWEKWLHSEECRILHDIETKKHLNKLAKITDKEREKYWKNEKNENRKAYVKQEIDKETTRNIGTRLTNQIPESDNETRKDIKDNSSVTANIIFGIILFIFFASILASCIYYGKNDNGGYDEYDEYDSPPEDLRYDDARPG